ncbi:MAG: hypothetical protein JNM99_05550 [Verrucomicrobiaceae bacterium]|nr:hypothetical protein [Verrucomicrobiaceae bacterium]
MIHVTTEQFARKLSTWLSCVKEGETVAIMAEQGGIVAYLLPPDETTLPGPATNRSMADWLDEQDQRMQRTFGNRVVADSAAVLDDQRGGQ